MRVDKIKFYTLHLVEQGATVEHALHVAEAYVTRDATSLTDTEWATLDSLVSEFGPA